MTTTQPVADMIDHHLTTRGVTIDPTQRDRIADMIDHYVDLVHVNRATRHVIDELATPHGRHVIASELADAECQCEIPFTGMDPECIACNADIDADVILITNHLTPVLHQLLTT